MESRRVDGLDVWLEFRRQNSLHIEFGGTPARKTEEMGVSIKMDLRGIGYEEEKVNGTGSG
jgi:hypothetical protein